MLYWKKKIAPYFKIGPYGVAASVIIALSVLLRTILVIFHYPDMNSDEGKMGIGGIHIAFHAQFYNYNYGQDYLGALEAYLAAPFFRLFGVSDITFRMGMLLMFTLFMILMYCLASWLYSKRLALVTLALLSFGTSDLFIEELRAIGGAMELILFAALMMLLAYHLAATAGAQRRRRYLSYFAWGWTVGIALWVHILVLPFVLCSGLLILVFCYREWRSLAIPSLFLGLLVGGFLLIPGYLSISHALSMQSGSLTLTGMSGAQLGHVFRKQLVSTFLWGVPMTSGLQPVCAITDLPYYGPRTSLTLSCSLFQGIWSTGYFFLLGTGLFLAGTACWKIWKQQRTQSEAVTPEGHQEAVRQFARLMLLFTGVLIIFLYARSPLSGVKPWSTRYIVGLLVVTPAIIWPLWRLTGLEQARLTLRGATKKLSRVAVAVMILVALGSTIWNFTQVPAAYAEEQQQMQLVNDLLKMKVTHVYLEYWTCYRLLFQSQEQILCATPPYPATVGGDSYPPDAQPVKDDPNAPFMFPATSSQEIADFEAYNAAHNLHFKKMSLDGMVLYIPLAAGASS